MIHVQHAYLRLPSPTMTKHIAAILTTAILAATCFAATADANPPVCEYNQAIAGCTRTVYIVANLPDDTNTVHFGGVYGLPDYICADVGFDQTWCTPYTIPVAPTVQTPTPAFTG